MSSKPKRVVYIHGNQTTHWSFAWAPWVEKQAKALGLQTHFTTMPDSRLARRNIWLAHLEKQKIGENDILLGWSSGAVAAMRFAEKHRVAGSVLVSPCWTDLGDKLEKLSGWYRDPWDWDSIKANQPRIELISGTDDPFIPQEEFSHIAKELNANHTQVKGEGHFTKQVTFAECVDALKRLID